MQTGTREHEGQLLPAPVPAASARGRHRVGAGWHPAPSHPTPRSHRRLQPASSPGLAVLQPPPLQTEDAAPPSSPRLPPAAAPRSRPGPRAGARTSAFPPPGAAPPLGCCQPGMRWLSPGLAVARGHGKGRWVLLLQGPGGRRVWGRVSGQGAAPKAPCCGGGGVNAAGGETGVLCLKRGLKKNPELSLLPVGCL